MAASTNGDRFAVDLTPLIELWPGSYLKASEIYRVRVVWGAGGLSAVAVEYGDEGFRATSDSMPTKEACELADAIKDRANKAMVR